MFDASDIAVPNSNSNSMSSEHVHSCAAAVLVEAESVSYIDPLRYFFCVIHPDNWTPLLDTRSLINVSRICTRVCDLLDSVRYIVYDHWVFNSYGLSDRSTVNRRLLTQFLNPVSTVIERRQNWRVCSACCQIAC